VDTVLTNQIGSVQLFKNKDKSYKINIDAMHALNGDSMLMKLQTDDGKHREFNLPLPIKEAPYIISETLAHYPAWDNVEMALGMIRKLIIYIFNTFWRIFIFQTHV